MDFHEMRRKKKALGLTNRRLAELSGVPLGTVQKILSGKTKSPRLETMIALECVLLSDIALDYTYDLSAWEKEHDEAHRLDGLQANRVKEVGVKYTSDNRISSEETNKEPKQKREGYTIDDYYAWPEDERVELINGKIYNMAAPSYIHQTIALYFSYKVWEFIDAEGGDCIPGIAPLDVQLDMDEKTMVQPDALILCDKKKQDGKKVIGAPDFVLEVLSESSRSVDVIIKTGKYMNAGCREYWIVDPENETVWVYDFEHDRYPLQYTFEDSVPVNIYDGMLEIDFRELKSRLQQFFGDE